MKDMIAPLAVLAEFLRSGPLVADEHVAIYQKSKEYARAVSKDAQKNNRAGMSYGFPPGNLNVCSWSHGLKEARWVAVWGYQPDFTDRPAISRRHSVHREDGCED
jgi:hypothetical protein